MGEIGALLLKNSLELHFVATLLTPERGNKMRFSARALYDPPPPTVDGQIPKDGETDPCNTTPVFWGVHCFFIYF